MKVVVDTSCIASFFLMDNRYQEAKGIMEKVISGEVDGCMSALSLAELCGVIRRQADRRMAVEVKEKISDLVEKGLLPLVPLTAADAHKAAELAVTTGLKGADAVVMQAARRAGAHLCTFDEEIIRKGMGVVEFYTAKK